MEAGLEGGFADTVLGAQSAFRAIMDGLANPGAVQPLEPVVAPASLGPQLAAVALTLCDHDTALWLDPLLAEDEGVVRWLRFHTGAPLTTDPALGQFALVSAPQALPRLDRFAPGTQDYPDRSTTVVLALPWLSGGPALTLSGPGIADVRTMAPAGLPHDFAAQWAANRALFPRGVDLLLVAGGALIGLPRSTRIAEG